jgi:DNA-binding CsgD family transcriptional regulator
LSNTGQVIAVRSHDVRGAGSGSLAAYPNAVVITDGIAEVRSASIVTDIYATAFHIGDAFDAMDIRGVGGESMVQYVDPRSAATLSRLTPREREVLAELATGFSNRTVAQRLVLSQRAVEKHINSIFAKLGLTVDDSLDRRVKAVLMFLDDRILA